MTRLSLPTSRVLNKCRGRGDLNVGWRSLAAAYFAVAYFVVCLLVIAYIGGSSVLGSDNSTAANGLLQIEKEQELGSISSQSAENLQAILEKQPNNARALLVLGNYYVQRGFLTEAEESFRKAMMNSGDSTQPTIQLAKFYMSLGEEKKSLALLDAERKRFPNDASLLMAQGSQYCKQGKFAEAENVYGMVQKSNPGFLGVGSAIAEIRLQQRRFGEALKLCEPDLKRNKNYLPANLVKAQALVGSGQFRQAVEPLQAVFEREPFRPQIAEILAQCLVLSNNFSAALQPALVNLALCVKSPAQSAAKLLVVRLMKKVPGAQAQSAIEIVLRKLELVDREEAANFHFVLGDVFDDIQCPAAAMAQYRAGLAINPQYGHAWLRLAKDTETYRHCYQEALQFYARAYAVEPGCSECLSQSERLSVLIKERDNDLAWQLKDWLWRRN